MMPIVRLSQIICGLLLLALLFQLCCLAIGVLLQNQQLALGGGDMQIGIYPPDYGLQVLPLLQQSGYSELWLSLPEQCFFLLLNFWLLRLFWLYRQMQIFTRQNVQYFQLIGILLSVWALWQVLYPPLVVTVVNWLQQTDQLKYLTVHDYQLLLFIGGLIVWAIGRVMAYGLELQQEQDLVI